VRHFATVALVVFAAGCGRIDFDPLARTGDAGGVLGDATDAADAMITPDAAIIPPGAGLWLKMDSGPGSGIIDSAGGHTTACTTNCPALVPGLHGNAYSFDGTDFIATTYASDLDASSAFSAAMWIELTADPAHDMCPYGKSYNPTMGWDMFVFCVDTSDHVYFDGEDTSGTTSSELGSVIALDTWHHLAWTWDGVTKRVYQDGALVAQAAIALGSSNTPFEIGGGTGYEYTGLMDDLVFYTRTLSAAEIVQLATP
jgi:hypothetical protein